MRVLLGFLLAGSTIASRAASVDSVEFNRDIRPILSDKCYTCHGPDAANRKTKLRFDIESGARIDLRGGRKAIVAGDPAASEMYRRISSDNKAERMPPAYAGSAKLTDREIDLVRRWIEQGGKWQAHWSFIPPQKPALPEVKQKDWPRNPIDYFVLERLEREGLKPSPEADRRTLIRRVSLDLTGLPPTPAEVDAFLADRSPNAYEKMVDHYLASPHYGERMAFRWMEAARYGDTNGYQTDGKREMWRWRDWVIDAFNHNMPYDRFTIEQLAGDLLPNPTLDQRVATAFHRNHRTTAEGGIVPEEFRVEYVADRTETTSNVWLGLTLGCARCHDHKYDPLKQKEFYQIFAFFNNQPDKGLVYNWGNEEPAIKAPTPDQQERLKKLDAGVAATEQKWNAMQADVESGQHKWERKAARVRGLDWTVEDGLTFRQPSDGSDSDKIAGCGKEAKACELPLVEGVHGKARQFDGKRYADYGKKIADFDFLDPFTFSAWIKPESPKGVILSHYEDYFEGQGHGLFLIDGKIRLHIVFRWTDIGIRLETVEPVKLHDWQHVLVTYDGSRWAAGVRIYVNGRQQKIKVLFDELNWPMDAKSPFRIGAGAGMGFEGAVGDARVYKRELTPEEAMAVSVPETIEQIAALPAVSRTPAQNAKLRLCYLARFAPRKIQLARAAWASARRERETFYKTIPTVMVQSETHPRDAFVLKRGAYDAHGDKVTPDVPAVLPPMKPEWPKNRLGLARWLVDRGNPLTARVTVNRYWAMYFGTGIVKTVQDFGSQGEQPSHPALLDWLATEFMDSGWNVKAMQKTILMSATYRQSSKVTPQLIQVDPANRLLARGPRLRLGPEMIRDQALDVSGLLVDKLGGPSVKPYQPPGLWKELGSDDYKADTGAGLYRRSLYTYWRRTVAPPFMINFDSPNRETCTVQENRTDTPLQALDLMNDEQFVEASRKLAERMLREGGKTPAQRIEYAYRLVLARAPKPAEEKVVLDTLSRFEARYRNDAAGAGALLAQGESARDPKLNVPELAAYTSVASLVLNLDETITKE